MRRKILALMILAAFSFLFIFGGCGNGGGGGDEGDGNSGLKYTGETAPAEIDQDNAVDIAAGAFAAGKTGTLFQPETALPVDNLRMFRVPQILGDAARSIDLRPHLHNLSLNTAAVYTETGTVNGSCGGSFDYTVNKDDVSGEFEGTIIFSHYCDHCVSINGNVDFEGEADRDSGDIITITFRFDNLSDGTMTMDGEVSMDFSVDPIICTLDALFKDEITGKVFWAQNYSLNLDVNLFGKISQVEIFGTFYHPDYGYVTVSTEEPFFFLILAFIEIDEWPRSGRLVMNGANDTNASLTAIEPICPECIEPVGRCEISADTDGDGVYDWNSGVLNWSKPAIDPENWMGDLGDHIKTLKIKNVVLPGTHDSNTDSRCWSAWYIPLLIHCDWVQAMLRCQDHSPRIQLEDGIRYFDLRYEWRGSGDDIMSFNLVIYHGDKCSTDNGQIQKAITWVKEFAESHPKEIVILDLSHWKYMNEARHRAAAKYIVEQLGKYMVPWNIDPNAINFGSPEVTVQDLWKAEKNVIVIYNDYSYHPQLDEVLVPDNPDDPDPTKLFWGAESYAERIIVTPWPNTNYIRYLEPRMKTALNCRSDIDYGLLECKDPDAQDKLFVLQSQLTGYWGHADNELWKLAERSNPFVIKWLQEWPTIGDDLSPTISPEVARKNLNIVIVDFYHKEGGKDIHNSCRNKSFVETIVELNLNRAPLF